MKLFKKNKKPMDTRDNITFNVPPSPPSITPEEFVWYARGLMDSELSALTRQQSLNPDSTIELNPTLDKLFRKLNQVK
jgi:hypothetical protein